MKFFFIELIMMTIQEVYLVTKFIPIGMTFVRSAIPVLFLFVTVKGPVRIIKSKPLDIICFIGIANDGCLATLHVNDQLGLPANLPFVKGPEPNGNLDIFLFSHVAFSVFKAYCSSCTGWSLLSFPTGNHDDGPTIYVVATTLSSWASC
jgi:hypothetical protein